MFTLLVILAIIYIVLKVLNTRARFAESDARRAAEEAAAEEAKEEFEEAEEIKNSAIDVEADTIETSEPEDVAFAVEENAVEEKID